MCKYCHTIYTPVFSNIAGWNMDPLIEDVFPIKKMGDITGSYVSLPEGIYIYIHIMRVRFLLML